MKQKLIILFLLAGVVGLNSGCDTTEGPAERVGERVDEISDNIKEGEPPLKEKGTAEEVGEEIDEGVEDLKDSMNDK